MPRGLKLQTTCTSTRDLNIHSSGCSSCPGSSPPLQENRGLSWTGAWNWCLSFPSSRQPMEKTRAINLSCSQNFWDMVACHKWWISQSGRKKMIKPKPRESPPPPPPTPSVNTALPFRQYKKNGWAADQVLRHASLLQHCLSSVVHGHIQDFWFICCAYHQA